MKLRWWFHILWFTCDFIIYKNSKEIPIFITILIEAVTIAKPSVYLLHVRLLILLSVSLSSNPHTTRPVSYSHHLNTSLFSVTINTYSTSSTISRKFNSSFLRLVNLHQLFSHWSSLSIYSIYLVEKITLAPYKYSYLKEHNAQCIGLLSDLFSFSEFGARFPNHFL